jgi:hypothetical protein
MPLLINKKKETEKIEAVLLQQHLADENSFILFQIYAITDILLSDDYKFH